MTGAKKNTEEREILTREGEVTGWRAEVWAHNFTFGEKTRLLEEYQKAPERDARPSINVLGTFTKDVKGVSQFDFWVMPGKPDLGKAEILSVGAILKAKPVLEAHVTLSEIEYLTVLALATTGHLRYLSCHFQTPRYGKALISSLTFGSHKPKE